MGISLNPASILSGQGIDVSSIVQQVLSNSSGPLTEWQSEQSTLQTQAGDLNIVNSDLTRLATAVQALSDPLGPLTAVAATSSDGSVLSATATTSAASASHQIVVTNLASHGLVYTNPLSAGADASFLPNGATSGEIDLQVGGGTAQPIQITAGTNDTLNTLASYINTQNLGVNASVVTDSTGSRLALVSQATGSPGALAIASNNTSLAFNAPTGGANASLTIDGIPISSPTNTITSAISGVTINLAGTAPGSPVQLDVGPDQTQITNAVNNFVSAYNQIIGDINQEFTFNASNNRQGPLGSDTALRSLQSSLLSDASYAVPGDGGLVNLSSLGINQNDDGTLTVGSSPTGQTLAQVLSSNPTAFTSFFQNSASTGFANNFNTDLTNLTDPTVGVLSVDITQNKAQQQTLSDNISDFQVRLAAEQQSLTAQFDQVNATLQAYPLLLQQVTETLGTLGTTASGSGGSSNPTLTSGL
jgi:flagellar hook-associated protein 2